MTVYVDDAAIAATVGRTTARWSDLLAHEHEELHAFAARLGLRREWFQDPLTKTRGLRPEPGSRAAENWHYDLTADKRLHAIQLGAVPVSRRELVEIIDPRYEASQ